MFRLLIKSFNYNYNPYLVENSKMDLSIFQFLELSIIIFRDVGKDDELKCHGQSAVLWAWSLKCWPIALGYTPSIEHTDCLHWLFERKRKFCINMFIDCKKSTAYIVDSTVFRWNYVNWLHSIFFKKVKHGSIYNSMYIKLTHVACFTWYSCLSL